MPRSPQPVPVRVELSGRRFPSETLMTVAGPYAVTFETTVPAPEVALTLVSSCVYMPGIDPHVSHVGRAAQGRAWTAQRVLPWFSLEASSNGRRCLLDHLAEVSSALAMCGVDPGVSLGDALPAVLQR